MSSLLHAGFSPVVASKGYSLVEVLIAAASPAAGRGF